MEEKGKSVSLSEPRYLVFFGICLAAVVGYGALVHSFREDDIIFFFYLLVPSLIIVGLFLLFSLFFPAIHCQVMGAPAWISITGYQEKPAAVTIRFSRMAPDAWKRFEVFCEIWLGKLQWTFVAGKRQRRWIDQEKKVFRVFPSGNLSEGKEFEAKLEVPEPWLPKPDPDPMESRTLTVWLFHPWFPHMKRILAASKDLSDSVHEGASQPIQAEVANDVPWSHSRGIIPSFALFLILWLGMSIVIPTGWLGFASAMAKRAEKMTERLDQIETLLFSGKDNEASEAINAPWEYGWTQKWDFSTVYFLRKRQEFLEMVVKIRSGKGTSEEIDRFRKENITPWGWLDAEFAVRNGDISGAFLGYQNVLAYQSTSTPRWAIPSLMTSLAYLEAKGQKPEAVAQALALLKIIQTNKTGDDLQICKPLESYCRSNAPALPSGESPR